VHDEVSGTVRLEPCQPAPEQLVEGRLADPDGRVAPQAGEREAAGRVVRRDHGDVPEAVGPRVLRAQGACPLVHVDRPDPSGGVATGERECDGAVATAEVDDVAVRHLALPAAQQRLRAGVEPIAGEDTAVGGQVEPDVVEPDPDGTAGGGRRRPLGEVVVGHEPKG
jgi:hypothetical protein